MAKEQTMDLLCNAELFKGVVCSFNIWLYLYILIEKAMETQQWLPVNFHFYLQQDTRKNFSHLFDTRISQLNILMALISLDDTPIC